MSGSRGGALLINVGINQSDFFWVRLFPTPYQIVLSKFNTVTIYHIINFPMYPYYTIYKSEC